MRALRSPYFLFSPSDFSLGAVAEIRRMFHAAWPAFHHPPLRPPRGSGLGAVPDTIGSTGFGIVFGGGGDGGGGVPRPPRPAFAGAPLAGAAAAGSAAGVAAGCAAGVAAAGGCAAGGGVVVAGVAVGDTAGGAAGFEDPPHAAISSASVPAANNPVNRFINLCPPACASSRRSRLTGPPARRWRT